MAAILQLRRSTSNASPSLTEGELFLHNGVGSIQFGSGSVPVTYTLLPLNAPVAGNINLIGNITASNATLSGDIRIGGNIYLGDTLANDNINVNAQFSGSMIPQTNNVFDLGSNSAKWRNIYIGGNIVVDGTIDGIDISSQDTLYSTKFTTLSSYTASVDTSFSNQATKNTTLGTYTASLETKNSTLANVTASLLSSQTNLNTFSASVLGHITDINTKTGSFETKFSTLGTYTASLEDKNSTLSNTTGSLISSASNIALSSSNIDSKFTTLGTYTSSINDDLARIHESTSSLNSYTSSQDTKNSTLATYTGSIDTKWNTLSNVTASILSYTSSLKTALELTGSNVVVLGDLTVRGTHTSINSTAISLGDNIIELNGTGVANGGLLIKDPTNASLISGSLLWDSTNDYWKAGTLGNESKILLADGMDIVSSSAQIKSLLPNGTVSGSSQVTSSLDFRYLEINGDNVVSSSAQVTALLPTGVVSGSTQIANLGYAITGSNTFTGQQIISSSLIVTNEIKGVGNIFLQPDVNDARYFQIYNTAAPSGNDIHFKGNADFNYFGNDINYLKIDDSAQTITITGVNGVFVSSSLNVTGSISASAGVTGSIAATNGVISGSSQVVYTSLSSIPAGIVSGSSQIPSVLPNGVVSGSSQLTSSYDDRYASSGSLRDLIGAHQTSGSLRTGAWYDVSSSIADGNPNTLGNAFAIKTYVDAAMVLAGAGDITAVNAGNGLSGGALSGSATLTLDTGSTHFTNGVDARLIPLTSLNSYTSSQDTRNTTLGTYTASLDTKNSTLSTYTASLDSKFSTLSTTTGSLITSASNIAISSSNIDSKFTTLGTYTASLDTKNTTLGTYTSSIETKFTTIGVSTASLNSYTSSQDTKNSTLSTYTASVDSQLSNLNASTSSFETKGRGIISSSAQLDGTTITNLTITNLITVSETASVIFSSGSNRFGDFTDDVHQFTGSVQITGSITTIGTSTATSFNGAISASNGVVSGSTQITKTLQNVTTAGATTSDVITFTNATSTISTGTGALVITGGVGIGGGINAGGDIVAYSSSDIRLKNNIKPIENAIEKINKIGGYTFDWNNDLQDIYSGKDYGVIAQEIEEMFPELVQTRENGYKAVKYDKLVSVLIAGIQELSKEITDLKNKIKE
jgi:hypothetical protein